MKETHLQIHAALGELVSQYKETLLLMNMALLMMNEYGSADDDLCNCFTFSNQ